MMVATSVQAEPVKKPRIGKIVAGELKKSNLKSKKRAVKVKAGTGLTMV